ncbi:hypothetical protein ACFFKU_06940 [Kineococcus gynurae]|uniref:Uncharacterized protein n=1 Tax=Kineococcus gynurae TaxID=452979 RepID=A0ABV5LX53_9ACTN
MSAAEERAALLRIAETEANDVAAGAACLIGHGQLRDPGNPAGWLCGCQVVPRPGEMHARHQATEILALLDRRRGARRAAGPNA